MCVYIHIYIYIYVIRCVCYSNVIYIYICLCVVSCRVASRRLASSRVASHCLHRTTRIQPLESLTATPVNYSDSTLGKSYSNTCQLLGFNPWKVLQQHLAKEGARATQPWEEIFVHEIAVLRIELYYMLHNMIRLYYTIYYIILYYIRLYYIILYHIILYYIILYYILL